MSLGILLVDDNLPDRIRYRRMLQRAPGEFAVTEAEDGQQALAALAAAAAAFDCVLLDQDLPDMHGLDVLLDIRQRVEAPPVVMLTGEEDAAVSIEALRRGAADYLMKRRIDEDRLQRAIHGAIGRAQLSRQLRENERRLERFYRLASQTEDALFIADADTGRVSECNEAARRLLRLAPDAAADTIPAAFDGAAHWQAFCQRTRQAGAADHEWQYSVADGSVAAMEIRARCLREDDRVWLFAVGRDISLRKQRERELTERSLRDALTGAWNRRAFDERLAESWAEALRARRPLALVMVDVDHFKAYNDSCGHLAGDECLRQVVTALQAGVRTGVMVARYGGEEFAVVVADADGEAARSVGERLRATVAAAGLPHPRSSTGSLVSISAGVASTVPDADRDPEDLIAAADTALYRAKQAGRNRVVLHAI